MRLTPMPARLTTARRDLLVVSVRLRTAVLVLREARPKVLAIGGVRFLSGALLSGGLVLSPHTLVGLLAWILMTVAVYVLNGVTDVDTDRVNGSRRPVASGRLTVRAARRAVWVCGVAALGLGLVVSWFLVLHLAVALALGVRYSSGAKPAKASSPAAFVVVVVGGLVTYHAGLVASGGRVTAPFVVFAVCLSLWMGVGSLVKDLPDVDGDRAANRFTLAVSRGPDVAADVAAVAAATIAAAMAWAAFGPLPLAELLRWPSVVLCLGTLILVVTCVTVSLRARWPYRAFMYTQFAAHGPLLQL
ncbi:UbiA family prenyltransferase [Isoptericola halotolerans]|uniref:UbiA family prenyltransferase n=1 Tax=Isoptericola halotolerans TaxID=300560 RepID=UPI00388E9518